MAQNERTESDIEYSAQYFGFTAKRFCNGVYNATVEYMAEGMKALTDSLIQQNEGDDAKVDEIQTACRDAHKKAIRNADVYFDKLESFLCNSIFYVPQHVALPEDTHHDTIEDVTQEEACLDAQIMQLQQQIHTVHHSTMALLAEQKACQQYTDSYTDLLNSCPLATENTNLSEQLLTLEKDLKCLMSQQKLLAH